MVFNSIVNDSRLLKAHVQTSKICLLLLLNLLQIYYRFASATIYDRAECRSRVEVGVVNLPAGQPVSQRRSQRWRHLQLQHTTQLPIYAEHLSLKTGESRRREKSSLIEHIFRYIPLPSFNAFQCLPITPAFAPLAISCT